MEGSSVKKSMSLETLVIQTISNVNDLKSKLNEIIKIGKDYRYDVSSCIKSLLNSSDQDIVTLSVQAISELAKCEEKRETYAGKDVIHPILQILEKEVTTDRLELIKQACRALGNLCCDSDTSRNIILEAKGVPTIKKLIETSVDKNLTEIKMLSCKTLLNFTIGGQQYCDAIVQENVLDLLHKILHVELWKVDVNDEMISTALLVMSVINDHTPEFLFTDDINKDVLGILRETTNIEISELCLEHLHAQAEHDSVKTLLANEGGVQLVCSRLEQLMKRGEDDDLASDENDIEAIIKQACDLIIIVLTGDEAMHKLYNNGVGEVYLTMVRWLDSINHHLLTTAVLAIGNFARQDDYCIQMMDDKIYDKLLDIFDTYHNFAIKMQAQPDSRHPIDASTVTKIQHGVLSALRNLTVPVANKRTAAANGRAASLFVNALPNVNEHHVAYKLLAAIRMSLDGQEGVAGSLARSPAALAAVARWGHAGECAGAAGEAPRLLAWCVKQLRDSRHWRHIVQVDGCVSSLVNMLLASHSLMQNEAILALTLLAIESLKKLSPDSEQPDFDYEQGFSTQLIKSEIGKHITVLVDTNCAKMPIEVAENLLAFLDITSKKNEIATDYKQANVHESLRKFADSRNDLSVDMKACVLGVIKAISDGD